MKVVINGGHYPGMDCGAVGQRTNEAAVTQQLMELTAAYLRKAGCEVLAVQENELADIVLRSCNFNAELFVSIHCNAADSCAAKGTETYYYSKTGAELANCIQSQLVNSLPLTDRGIREGRWLYVLKYTACPAVLVETAFISNRDDETLLLYNQTDFARAIARGVTDYLVMNAGKM